MFKICNKNIIKLILFMPFMAHAVNLSSMTAEEIKQTFINKTFVSIPTDNLNGKTINNTFSMYLDDKGNMWGKMSQKPVNEPQYDTGKYVIKPDGTIYFTWKHWDYAKQLCGHIYATQNAYISIDCGGVFHTVFMKDEAKNTNLLIVK